MNELFMRLYLPLESWPVSVSDVLSKGRIVVVRHYRPHTPTATIAIPLRKKLRALAPSFAEDIIRFCSWPVSRWAIGGEINCWHSVVTPSSGEDLRMLSILTVNGKENCVKKCDGKSCGCKCASFELRGSVAVNPCWANPLLSPAFELADSHDSNALMAFTFRLTANYSDTTEGYLGLRALSMNELE
jgi:hypothetical protein